MAFDREAAREAGYSEEEINAFLQANPKLQQEEKKTEPVSVGEPPAPSTVINEVGTTPASVATTGALAVAPYAIPAAGAAAAALGGNKLYGAWKQSAQAAQALADAKMASEQGIAQRAAVRAGAPMPSAPATGPVAPTNIPPTAPAAAPTANPSQAAMKAPTMLDRANQIVRSLALDKVLKGGAAAGFATYSGGLNTNEQEELNRRRAMEVEQARKQGWIK